MKKIFIIILAFFSFVANAQVGQWDSTETIIYPTDTTGKIVLAAGDTLYLIDVSKSDSGLNYINRRSLVKMIYDFDQDASDDTIPARILFQNYDFDSLFYSRINGNKISEIEVYSSATDRVSYFDVPYDPSTGVIVDYTGGGDYTTINAAVLATSGNIFIKSGTYDENSGSSYLNLPNTEYLIGVGNVTVTSPSTTTGIAIRGNGTVIKNIEFDAEGNTANMVVFVSTGTNSTLENCYVHSFTNSAVFHTYYNDRFIGCVFDADGSLYTIYSIENYSMYFDNCYFTGDVGSNHIQNLTGNDTSKTTVINTKFEIAADDYVYIGSSYLDFNYNHIHADSTNSRMFAFTANNLVPDINFIGDTLIWDAYGESAALFDQTTDTFNFLIDGGEYYGLSGGGTNFVFITDVDTLSTSRFTIQNAKFDFYRGGITAFRNTIYPGYQTVQNNEMISRYAANDNSYFNSFISSDTLSPVIFTGNLLSGPKNYGSSFGMHTGAMFNDCEKSTIKNNRTSGFGLSSIIDKGDGLDKSNSIIQGNVMDDLIVKGIKKTKIYNNTFFGSDMYAVWIYKNLDVGITDGSADSNEFKNNIVYSDTCFYVNQVDTIFSDYNVIYGNIIAYNGVSTYNWAQWQALGYDANSYNTDPNLNASGVPQTPSDAIGNGLNLGANYNVGLSPTATFPDPLTTLQKALWSIGAYVVPLNGIATSNVKVVLGTGRRLIHY